MIIPHIVVVKALAGEPSSASFDKNGAPPNHVITSVIRTAPWAPKQVNGPVKAIPSQMRVQTTGSTDSPPQSVTAQTSSGDNCWLAHSMRRCDQNNFKSGAGSKTASFGITPS